MLSEIKLVISQNDKVIQTVTKELSSQGLVKSIQDFQKIANATMTKLIEDSGDAGEAILAEDADDSDNEDENVPISPKKRKK